MVANIYGCLFGDTENPRELAFCWYCIDDFGNYTKLKDSSAYSAFYYIFQE